jgi:hypothetical protein
MITTLKKALRALPAAAVALGLSMMITGVARADVPSYATRTGESIHGTISGFNGQWTVYVRDQRGYTDNVALHSGTVINPTGIRLQAGFPVTVYGHPSGDTFVADEIDTPYHYVPAAYYPYPYYGPYYHPWVGLRAGFWWR